MVVEDTLSLFELKSHAYKRGIHFALPESQVSSLIIRCIASVYLAGYIVGHLQVVFWGLFDIKG